MIKLLPITRCTQCHLLTSVFTGHNYHHVCTNTDGGGTIKNINEIPEWCPLDDAEVQDES